MKKCFRTIQKTCMATMTTLLLFGTTATANTFSDVESGAWYTAAVNDMAAQGFISGTTNTTFAPKSTLTVGAFSTMMARAFYGDSVTSATELGWWQPYMEGCASRNGLVGTIAENQATWNTTANESITRYDMAVMVYNLLQSQNVERLTPEEIEIVLYTVPDQIPSQYQEAVATAFAYNFLSGKGDAGFDGDGILTRAESAAVLQSLVNSEMIAVEKHDLPTAPAVPTAPAPDVAPEVAPEPEPAPAVVANPTTAEEKNVAALVVAKEIAAVAKEGDTLQTLQNAAAIVSMYYNNGVHVESGTDYSTAYGVFVKGESSCAGATRGLGMVLECMGYDWTHANENEWLHQWCEVTVDGTTYYADGQVGIVGVAPHPFELM
ncbi:MAG: S-layer homology domain-containing protein [Bacillota bacterium]